MARSGRTNHSITCCARMRASMRSWSISARIRCAEDWCSHQKTIRGCGLRNVDDGGPVWRGHARPRFSVFSQVSAPCGCPLFARFLRRWSARKRIEKLRYLLVTPGLVSRDVDGSLRRLGIAQREKFPGLSTRRKPRCGGFALGSHPPISSPVCAFVVPVPPCAVALLSGVEFLVLRVGPLVFGPTLWPEYPSL